MNKHIHRARTALIGYGGNTDIDTAIIDMLTDTLHLCCYEGLDFRDLLLTARAHFEEENQEIEDASAEEEDETPSDDEPL